MAHFLVYALARMKRAQLLRQIKLVLAGKVWHFGKFRDPVGPRQGAQSEISLFACRACEGAASKMAARRADLMKPRSIGLQTMQRAFL